MSSVITTQPAASETNNFLPLTEGTDLPPADTMPEGEEHVQEAKKKAEQPMSELVEETADCCFELNDDDCLSSFFCCRFLSDCLVGCGECTEGCCESCCNCLCNCEGDGNADTDGCGEGCTDCMDCLACCDCSD